MKLASLKHGRDGRLVVVSRDLVALRRRHERGADPAGGARRLGRGRAASHRDRGCARSRAHRARAVRPGEMRLAAAALARLGRRFGLCEPCRAGAPRARRGIARLVLDRSADVSRRLGSVHRAARSDSRRRYRVGRRSRSRGRRDLRRRPDGRERRGGGRGDPADRDPERRELPQSHSGRARQGLRLPARQGTDRVFAGRGDAGRARVGLGRREAVTAAALMAQRRAVRPARRGRRHDLRLPDPGRARREDPPARRRRDRRLRHRVEPRRRRRAGQADRRGRRRLFLHRGNPLGRDHPAWRAEDAVPRITATASASR